MELKSAEEPEVIVQEDVIGSQPELRQTKLILSIASLVLVMLAIVLLWAYVPSFQVYFSDIPTEFYWFLIRLQYL